MQYKPSPAVRNELSKRTWSFSSLEKFNACPYSFYRTYILKDRRELPTTFFGSAGHQYAEDFIRGLDPNRKKLFEKFKVPEFERADFEYCADNIEDFSRSQVSKYRYQVEKKHFLKVGKYEFVFIIDLVVFRGGNVYLFDWKTGKSAKWAQKYSKQMGFYKHALQKLYPHKEVITHIIYPRLNKTVLLPEVHFNEKEIEDRVDTLLKCQDFQPVTHKFCNWCEFKRKECPIYNPED